MADKKEQKLTPEDFEEIAIRISDVADNYRRIAETMRARQIDELPVFGIDTLESVTLSRINGPLASANRALLTARKAKPPAKAAAEEKTPYTRKKAP